MNIDQILYSNKNALPAIAVCDHYAGNEKFIRKAFGLQKEIGPLFDITCDLEDGAKTGNEEEHARLIAELLMSEENSFRQAGFRIHDFDSPFWKQDLKIVLQTAAEVVSHITIPKIESYQNLSSIVEFINSLAGGRVIPVHVLIETHAGLSQVFEIAAHPQVQSLEFGLMDFISAHAGAIPASCMESPGQFENALVLRAKTLIGAAAAAHAKIASHSVTTAFSDTNRVTADATKAYREFGFLRMWSIHPSQIEPIINALSPDSEEVALATQLLKSASQADWGPITFRNRLHDRASYRYYWEVLKRARRVGQKLPEESKPWFSDD